MFHQRADTLLRAQAADLSLRVVRAARRSPKTASEMLPIGAVPRSLNASRAASRDPARRAERQAVTDTAECLPRVAREAAEAPPLVG
jgi:hypothetical protein